MKPVTTYCSLSAIAIACCLLASQTAQAQDATFVNPEWANSAWKIGAGIGPSRANIDNERIIGSLTAHGETMSSFRTDEKDLGYKLFVGKQLSRNWSVEAGYFDLGKFNFASTTAQGGALNGEAGFRGVNLDLVAQLPLSARFSLLGRAGMQYAKASTDFSGNRLNAVTGPNPGERSFNPKIGLGVEYKFTEALALRGEVERYRLKDGIGNKGDVDLATVSLVYKLGRPAPRAAAPYVAPAAAPAPVAVAPAPPPPPPPKPVPVPVSEKVSFAAEALFDFDKSVVKPEGKAALDDLLGKLQGMNTEVMVTVGHTDAVGSDAYNAKLSQRRAEAVKAYIVSKGVDGSRVFTEGKGESQPVADNKRSDGRARNRRVTVEVVGTRTVTK